jgi:hypothetical protein
MGSKSSPPPAPDYAGAAQATAVGNLDAARQAQIGNMVNQVTPQGSVTYNPIGQTDGVTRWQQTVNLSPEQQALYQQNQAINQQLGDVAGQGVGYVQQALNQPLSFQGMQSIQSPELIQQQASDAAYQNATRYLDPQFQRQQAEMENQLSNQGITSGSEAWNNAMQQQDMARQQAYEGARNQAYLQGMQGSQQLYGQGMGTRQQQLSEAQLLRQDPINMLNAVRTGQQMQVSQQPQVGMSAPGQRATTAGPDLLGAASATGQYNQGIYNAQSASDNALMSGLFSLGSAGLKYSDRRLKKNIERIGTHALGIGLYAWEYLWGEKSEGVMADEVETVMPEAVIVHPNGFKMVNYAMIGG